MAAIKENEWYKGATLDSDVFHHQCSPLSTEGSIAHFVIMNVVPWFDSNEAR